MSSSLSPKWHSIVSKISCSCLLQDYSTTQLRNLTLEVELIHEPAIYYLLGWGVHQSHDGIHPTMYFTINRSTYHSMDSALQERHNYVPVPPSYGSFTAPPEIGEWPRASSLPRFERPSEHDDPSRVAHPCRPREIPRQSWFECLAGVV